jgi:hypothetical protein
MAFPQRKSYIQNEVLIVTNYVCLTWSDPLILNKEPVLFLWELFQYIDLIVISCVGEGRGWGRGEGGTCLFVYLVRLYYFTFHIYFGNLLLHFFSCKF